MLLMAESYNNFCYEKLARELTVPESHRLVQREMCLSAAALLEQSTKVCSWRAYVFSGDLNNPGPLSSFVYYFRLPSAAAHKNHSISVCVHPRGQGKG